MTRAPSAYSILEEYNRLHGNNNGEEKTCAVCGVQAEKTCLICNNAAYCGEAHEAQDRSYHRIICSAAALIPPRPVGEDYVAVLVLPEYSKTPYYTWVQYKLNRHNLPVFDQSAWYGSGYKSMPTFILRHPVTRQPLPYAIMFFQLLQAIPGPQTRHDVLSNPPSETNICIHNLAGGVNSLNYKGTNIVVTLVRSADRTKNWLLSFKPEDISVLIEEFKRPALVGNQPVTYLGAKAVACYPSPEPDAAFPYDNTTDVKHADYLAIEPLEIPLNHPIFTHDRGDPHIYVPPLSNVYKFPLRMYRFLNYKGPCGNEFVPKIFPAVKITRSTSGPRPSAKPSKLIAERFGPVIFARTDGKPLEVAHLKAFSDFIAHITKIWQEYNAFMATQEKAIKKLKEESKGETAYIGILKEQMDLVIQMNKTLEVESFKNFWMEKNGADNLGPFEGVDMDSEEEEHSEEEEVDEEGVEDEQSDEEVEGEQGDWEAENKQSYGEIDDEEDRAEVKGEQSLKEESHDSDLESL
ncbi:hypothetical protein TWF718_009505 [Orbilia javanica]|uniref:MYND-type domain-containing protein n=1 Tax=Orbilia javanica TaxID=47235 RepID=A0AAN8RFC0_9PEZI